MRRSESALKTFDPSAYSIEERTGFRPSEWPPSFDSPVVTAQDGRVVSRFGDPSWRIGSWIGVSTQISFGERSTRGKRISAENAHLLRLINWHWLFGPKPDRTPAYTAKKNDSLKPLFAACTEAGITADELNRFPQIIEKVASSLSISTGQAVVSLLYDLWLKHDHLGFTILDNAGLRHLSSLISARNSTQTAYIPPRIWTYQLLRLKQCLDDFETHSSQVESCYRYCVNAYQTNAGGSLAAAFLGLKNSQLPFHPANSSLINSGERVFYGRFRNTAEKFGIADLLDRWVNTSNQAGVKSLSSYLSLVSKAGQAYILNFSLMRADESERLRARCHMIERDSLGNDIHLIGGVTSKTLRDDDARWIVPPSVQNAVEAMRRIARLRIEVAKCNPKREVSDEHLTNPPLQTWVSEPWAAKVKKAERKRASSYALIQRNWPKLFDKDCLRISDADAKIANRMTLGLDPLRFGVNMVWPLAFHQLRRTGAVNMLSSGMVSDASLQYQLKHSSRAMTWYYGQNYFKLTSRLDGEAKGIFLREMYQSLAREIEDLRSERFISPHGAKHKEQVLRLMSQKDHDGLVKKATSGEVTYRQTFLGGCTKPGPPCDKGGVSNITECMGFDSVRPCRFALIDSEKRQSAVSLREMHSKQSRDATRGSYAAEFHRKSAESAQRAVNAIDKI